MTSHEISIPRILLNELDEVDGGADGWLAEMHDYRPS
jgi:hypothetical protein